MTLIAALFAAAVSAVIGSNAERLGRTLGLIDHPDPAGGRKRHDRATPLVGGIGVLAPMFAVLGQVALVAGTTAAAERLSLTWLLLAVFLMFLVGIVDDRFELAAKARLVTSVLTLSFCMVMAPELSLNFVWFSFAETVMLPSPAVGLIFSLLCMVGFANAINMADGKNGLVLGMCLIWSALLTLVLPEVLRPVIAALMAGLAIMLWFNWRSKLFLGDAGSYGLATLMGLIIIYVYKRRFAEIPADVIAVWFSVPVLDCLRLLISRALRGQSPFAGDRDHLHHHLGALHRNWTVGWSIYMALVALPSLVATLWPHLSPVCLAAVVLVYAGLILRTSRRFSIAGAA